MSEADGIKSLRSKAIALADEGDESFFEPKHKRKRAYYRALKRGAKWALKKKGMLDMMNSISRMMFRDTWEESAKMYGLNKMLDVTDSDKGTPVKIVYGMPKRPCKGNGL